MSLQYLYAAIKIENRRFLPFPQRFMRRGQSVGCGNREVRRLVRLSVKKDAITNPAIMKRVFEAAGALSPRHAAAVRILYETGMHASSLASLTKENVLADRLRWRRPKKQAKQQWLSCPMNEPLMRAAIYWTSEEPVTRRAVWKLIHRVGLMAGYPELSPMTFRHSRAVRLLRKGLPMDYVAAALGASPAIIRSTYGALTEEQMLDLLK